MKKFSITIIGLISLFLLGACGSQSTENSATSSNNSGKIYSGKTFNIALSPNFAPFETEKLDDGGETVVTGFDVDLVKQLSKDLGFEYKLTKTEFKGLIGALQSNRADFVISGMTATSERAKSVDFSDAYFHAQTAVMFPKKKKITTTSEMKGKKVAAVFGTNFDVQAEHLGATVTKLDTGALVLQELLSGRVDGGMMDATKAAIQCKENKGYDYYILPNDQLGVKDINSYSIAFPKNSELKDNFNKSIKQYAKDGTLDKLTEKWMGKEYLEALKKVKDESE